MTEYQHPPSCSTCGKPLPCVLHDRKTREAILAPAENPPGLEKLKSWEISGQASEFHTRSMRHGKILFYPKYDLGQMSLMDLRSGRFEHGDTLDTVPAMVETVAMPDGGFLMFGHHLRKKPVFLTIDGSGHPVGPVLSEFTSSLETPTRDILGYKHDPEPERPMTAEEMAEAFGTSKAKRVFKPSQMELPHDNEMEVKAGHAENRLDVMVGTALGQGFAFVGEWEVTYFDYDDDDWERSGASQRLFRLDTGSGTLSMNEIGAIPRVAINSAYALPDDKLLTVASSELCVLEVDPDGKITMNPIVIAGVDEIIKLQQIVENDWWCIVKNKFDQNVAFRVRLTYANGKMKIRNFPNDTLDEVYHIVPLSRTHAVGSSESGLVEIDVTSDPPTVRPLGEPRDDGDVQEITNVGNGQVLASVSNHLGESSSVELWGVPEEKLRVYYEQKSMLEESELPELPEV